MQNKDENKKDTFFNRILESRWFYLLLLVFIIMYVITDARVLNLPTWLFWIRYSVCIFLLVCLIIFRVQKYRQYYERKFRDKVYIAGIIISVLFFSLIFQAILNIPINLLIEKYSKQANYEFYNCELKNINTIGYDKVTFVFKEKRYTRYYSLAGLPSREIRKQYQVRLKVAESIFNTYCIKNLELVQNDE